MPLNIFQAGVTLQALSAAGGVSTLTLPSDVALSLAAAPRWVVDGSYVVLVNTPNIPLTVDAAGSVRPLTPRAPKTAPVLSAGSTGALTGTFRVRYSFVIEDAVGNVIAESDLSPVSNAFAIAGKNLLATGVETSDEAVTKRRFYRTTDNGAVYFPWIDLDGNTLTQVQDDLSDAGLSLVAAPILGTPPRLTLVAPFRGRLFGVGDVNRDTVRYTEAGLRYSWPSDNILQAPNAGSDDRGVTALVARREALGLGRQNVLAQITGTGAETNGLVDFDVVVLSNELGIESQESAQVFRDVAYFLWKDGVYSWSSAGIICVSDGQNGRGNVRSWFATDDYFNREMFRYAFAHMDVTTLTYRLFLASAGSTVINRWVEFDIQNGTWFGPHKTSLFDPTCAFLRTSAANDVTPVIGGAVGIYSSQSTRTDGTSTAIAFDVLGKAHDGALPDVDKYFGEVSIYGAAQTGGTLAVTTSAGKLGETRTKTQRYDLRQTRQRLGRLGAGRHAQVRLTNSEVGRNVVVYGYEIDPVNLLGRR